MTTSISLFDKISQADLYTRQQIKTQYMSNPGKLSDAIVPGLGTDGNIDVVRDFPWTLTPVGSPARAEAPCIILKEYYLLDSMINQSIAAYGLKIDRNAGIKDIPAVLGANVNSASLQGEQLYEGLYDLNDSGPNKNFTGFKYTLPFFSSDYLTTNNTWIAKPMYEEIIQLQKSLAQITGGAVGLGASVLKGAGAGFLESLKYATATTAAGLVATGVAPPAFVLTLGGTAVVDTAVLVTGTAIGAWKGFTGAKTATAVGAKLAEQTVMYERLKQQLEIGMNSGVGKLGDPALDKPQVWSTAQPRTHNITFPLFNTVDYSTLIKNWELCHILSYQNLYNKRNLFTGLPPVYYEITIPGVHYCKAGYISTLNILNVGNIHRIELPVGPSGKPIFVNIPDAYLVTITLNDFFIPSKNFLDVLTSDKSKVSASAKDLKSIVQEQPATKPEDYAPGGKLYNIGLGRSGASFIENPGSMPDPNSMFGTNNVSPFGF
jgi:hypothetical protein